MVTGSCLDAGHDVKTAENIEICMEVRNREQLHSYTGGMQVGARRGRTNADTGIRRARAVASRGKT